MNYWLFLNFVLLLVWYVWILLLKLNILVVFWLFFKYFKFIFWFLIISLFLFVVDNFVFGFLMLIGNVGYWFKIFCVIWIFVIVIVVLVGLYVL